MKYRINDTEEHYVDGDGFNIDDPEFHSVWESIMDELDMDLDMLFHLDSYGYDIQKTIIQDTAQDWLVRKLAESTRDDSGMCDIDNISAKKIMRKSLIIEIRQRLPGCVADAEKNLDDALKQLKRLPLKTRKEARAAAIEYNAKDADGEGYIPQFYSEEDLPQLEARVKKAKALEFMIDKIKG